jgi:hypothetical protein
MRHGYQVASPRHLMAKIIQIRRLIEYGLNPPDKKAQKDRVAPKVQNAFTPLMYRDA